MPEAAEQKSTFCERLQEGAAALKVQEQVCGPACCASIQLHGQSGSLQTQTFSVRSRLCCREHGTGQAVMTLADAATLEQQICPGAFHSEET